jgi:vacuolar iron transporter family protein
MTRPHEHHIRPGLLSDFILGSQDGLVNVLGILLGLAAASAEPRIIIIAALAALGAESVSMGAVAYTSTVARAKVYKAEIQRELEEMRTLPEVEREEVRVILREWGYTGDHLEEMVKEIESRPKMMLDLMMAFELKLAPVADNQARNSALIVFGATVVGSLIPLIPFFLPGVSTVNSAYTAIVISGIALFGIGWYEAESTVGPFWKSGVRMLLIGLGAGLAGFLIGHFAGVL